MSGKPFIPREQAHRDVEEGIDYYLSEAGGKAALAFVDAPERAYGHIARHPATGSPYYAHELDIPGLRSWPLRRYPWLVFYVERDDHVDVWRVLRAERDIPAWMREGADRLRGGGLQVFSNPLILLVGVRGFEPPTPASRSVCRTHFMPVSH